MVPYSTGVPPPRTAEDFEDVCHTIYSEAFDDPTATKNGRSGQKQNGVDIFVMRKEKRYGVQCKRKTYGSLTTKIVDEEVALADAGNVKIEELIVATTAPSDVALVEYAAILSDARHTEGKFRVSVAFWDTLENYIRRFPRLQFMLAPHMPGGAFWEQRQAFAEQKIGFDKLAGEMRMVLQSAESLARGIPEASASSLDKVIDGQLDGVKALLLSGKFDDALANLSIVGKDLSVLDVHQRARWHTQRAHCYWQKEDFTSAAEEFAAAYRLTPDDEKIASNAIRGKLLLEDYLAALTLGDELRQRFPASEGVFTAWAQASARSGATPEWKTVPPEMRDSPGVLHIFAWLAVLAGKFSEAARLASTAQQMGDRSFEVNTLRLLATVNEATQDGVLASNGIIAPAIKASLAEQISSFEPVNKVLWSRQSVHSLSQAVGCLGYAYMMIGRADLARELLLEAVKRFRGDRQLGRICLESCLRAGTGDDAFEFGRGNIANIDSEGRLIVAEMAARRGDAPVLDAVVSALNEEEEGERHLEDLQAFGWLLLAQQGKTAELVDALTETTAQALKSTSARITALTIAKREQMPWADAAIDALSKDITAATPTRDAVMAAQLFLFAHRFDDVVSCLEKRLPTGYFSEPHRLLFSALVQRGSRKRALQMLNSFPQTALEDSSVREDAVELARDAGDWERLSTLAELHLAAHPQRVDAWGFRASVFIAQKRSGAAREFLSQDIPLTLEGPLQYRTRLARLEIEFGFRERGFKRLYLAFRDALNSAEAASAYLGHILMLPPDTMPTEPTLVSSGCAVTLTDEFGESKTVVIDPDALGKVSEASNFVSSTSPTFEPLSGKRVGDAVAVSDGTGAPRRYIISGITSSFRWLAQLAQELIRKSVGKSGSLISVDLHKTPDGQYDLSRMLEMLKQRGDHVREVFAAYQRGQATVGIVAKLLGTYAAVVSGDWPQSVEANLYVCNGTPGERLEPEAHLADRDHALVVDLATVNELVAMGLEKVLAYSRSVYLTASASSVLDNLIAEEEGNGSRANIAEQEGRIILTELDDAYHGKRRAYLCRLRECVDKYCQIVPVYGVEDPPSGLLQFRELIDEESYDALLLALEKNAVLLTLDGRLRELASVVGGIKGVWPQIYVAVAGNVDLCSTAEYALFVFTSLIKRRSHVAISAMDFVWLLSQPADFQHFAMRALLKYIANPTVEWKSAVLFVGESLNRMAVAGTTLFALRRIIEIFAPLLFARRDADANLVHVSMELSVAQIVNAGFQPRRAHPMEAPKIAEDQARWRHLLSMSISKARRLAKEQTVDELASRPLNVAPVYCCVGPMYRVNEPTK
ncbi:tetratricopeptide repeat protein [Burkholderia gladioli]|uniref:tetratricopeptide repeat protein n=1 Tax=Burkholderia gladioli TaxID=28095 RepID=UPI000F7FFCB2|nr:hypothetical protein [Burkholderia gladioli]